MSTYQPVCDLCGEPMPLGEEMFKYHGYSGPCPKPPKQKPAPAEAQEAVEARLERIRVRWSQAGLTSFSQDHADVAWLLSLVRPPVAVPDGREKEIRSLLAMCDAGYNVAPVLIVEAAADLLRLLDAERERVRKEER